MSAFKSLFTAMINADGDASKMSADFAKNSIKVFVKETSPYFLVSDSFFYVPAYFTKAAIDEHAKKFPNVKVADLTEKVILINNWSLELKRVDSNAVFTSYAGVEVRLIIHSFKPQLNESITPTRWPTNLYRDDEFKNTIQQARHNATVAALAKANTGDAKIFAGKGFDWNFKEGNTAVVAVSGAKKAAAPAATAAAKVKGGAAAKRTAKAATKDTKKVVKAAPSKTVEKVLKFTPKKVVGKKSTGKKASSPGGKKSAAGTTDQMTMQTFKKFIKFQKDGKKLGKRPASGKVSKK
jgi:Telomere-binding protein beta subunit (TEBP beta)